jgi:branched-chain amino acid transport system substrate-binding protein
MGPRYNARTIADPLKEETMRSNRFRSSLALCLGLAVVLAAGASTLDAQGKGTIKIATQSPLSGGQAALGEGIKLGAQLAVEKFKGNLEKQGFKVEMVPFDDQAKPDVGVANARNIIADKDIVAVIGHLNSGVAIPSSEVYREVNLTMISPANTNPTVTDRGYPNVYRVCGRDDVQGVVGSEFAHGTLKAKSVYILHDKTTYGQGVAEFFKADAEKKGLKVLGFEGTEEKSNFDPLITPIKAKNPDLIYFGGIYEQGAPFFKQAREKGVKSKFLGPDGLDSSDLTKIAGKAVVGMHYTSVAGPVSVYPQAKQFADEFKKKFGKNPEPFAAQAYDSAVIALKAVEAAAKGGKAPSRDAVTAAVRDVKHTGITGAVEFDVKGDPKKALYFVLQVASDNPEKWGDNKEVKRLTIAAPSSKK